MHPAPGAPRLRVMAAALAYAILAATSPARADDVERAKVLYSEGQRQYDLGENEMALEAFKAAYLAKPEPTLLFNIGQCQRGLGRCNGTGALMTEPPSLPMTLGGDSYVYAVDLNADGRPDLVATDYTGNRVVTRLNTSHP